MQVTVYASASPHTAPCVCPHSAIYLASSYCYVCFYILLYMCPHTAMYVSSYGYIYVRILLYMCLHTAIYLYMCPHTAIYVSSYCYLCVLILLFIFYVSSYCYMCDHTSCTRVRIALVFVKASKAASKVPVKQIKQLVKYQ